MAEVKRSGFEPIPKYEEPCTHPQHAPPMHLHIPWGQQYRHICPACGYEIICRSAGVTL